MQEKRRRKPGPNSSITTSRMLYSFLSAMLCGNHLRLTAQQLDRMLIFFSDRYIRAFEVGRSPTSSKYDLAIRLRTAKNGPAVRNRVRLPHAVDSSLRICVICPPDSPISAQAIKAGATVVGEDSIFEAVKEGRIEFDRCICHVDSAQKLNQAGLGRILGPKGLMPSAKLGTVTKDVAGTVKGLVGGSEYREKLGVIRCAVGQLGFTPEEMQSNVKTFIGEIKKDLAVLSDRINKEIHEVVRLPNPVRMILSLPAGGFIGIIVC
jgi:large subunit ribosomal protein L1